MNKRGKRLLAFFLALVLLAGVMPVGVMATETTYFYLSAETGSGLLFAPQRVYYSEGQTIREALLSNSGHRFCIDSATGFVSQIDGIDGNYTRSSENGSFDLDAPASSVSFFCFSERSNSQPSAQRQQLIQTMADYLTEASDVQLAAKEAYDAAYTGFTPADDTTCAAYAAAITAAVDTYETSQQITFATAFSDGGDTYSRSSFDGVTVQAENAYGKLFSDDDGDGVLALPAGTYHFTVVWQSRRVEGDVTIRANSTVTAALAPGGWIDTDALAVSAAYGQEDFTAAALPLRQDGSASDASRTEAPDSFTGKLYFYVRLTEAAKAAGVSSLSARYTAASTGIQTSVTLAQESYVSGIGDVLSQGSTGSRVTLRVSMTDEKGYVMSEDHTVSLDRTPTLSALRVTGYDTAAGQWSAQAATEKFDSGCFAYTYRILDTITALRITPTSTGSYQSGYRVSVNGAAVEEGGSAEVSLEDGTTEILVEVRAGAYTSTYTMLIQSGAGKRISFKTLQPGTELVVTNSDGLVLSYTRTISAEDGCYLYQYTLVPGEVYNYVATKDTWFHAAKQFTLEQSENSTIQVDVCTDHWLSDLAVGTTSSSRDSNLTPAFSADTHSFAMEISDTDTSVYVWAAANAGTTAELSGLAIQAQYTQIFNSTLYDGKQNTVELTSGSESGAFLQRALMRHSAYGNTVTFRASWTDSSSGVTYYQDYQVTLTRSLSLEQLSVSLSEEAQTLWQQQTGVSGYSAAVTDYYVTVPAAATALRVDAQVYVDNLSIKAGDEETGYRVSVEGNTLSSEEAATVSLSGTLEAETVELGLTNIFAPEASTTYTITILKAAPVYVTAALSPEDGLLAMYETASGSRVWPEDGVYMLSDGFTYAYTVTDSGYVGESGTVTVTTDDNGRCVLRMADGREIGVSEDVQTGARTAALSFTLVKAEANKAIRTDIPATWSDFRGTSINADGTASGQTNNGVTDAATPVAAEDGTLYWASKIGQGFDSDAVSCPILVDGALVVYAGNTLYKVDSVSGEILRTGTMCKTSSYAINNPTYACGMIFVGLAGGVVQAFNADTLESLWVYTDGLGGQPNCPITVSDGYLYTGFWNNETSAANFVCLSITDEDPNRTDEEKTASWYYTNTGGFYWAGCCCRADYLLLGTDDGATGYTSQTSRLLLLDARTGAVLDSWTGLNGDIRSTVSYDEGTDAFYFTSKGGSFYSVRVTRDTGSWKLTEKKVLRLENGGSGTPMSTSTPVVCNGRAYIGVSGSGQFVAYSGHNITVIDLESWSIAYSVQTQGYPQTSGLLTTAYESETGYVYVYFFDNYTPGKLRVLRDKAGQTEAEYLTAENNMETAYALFTPSGEQAEYAICSPIADAYGTIYFKNDSAHLMAFGSAVKELQITTMPDKTIYKVGETLDTTGMVVTAVYANGMTRDVTGYVKIEGFDSETAGEKTVTASFPHVMYHNETQSGVMVSGVSSITPAATLRVTVEAAEKRVGDVNGNGAIEVTDAVLVLQYVAKKISTLDAAVADVNGDGTISVADAVLILQYVAKKIAVFPAEG